MNYSIPASMRVSDATMDYGASLDSQKAVKRVISATKLKFKYYIDKAGLGKEGDSLAYYSEFDRLSDKNQALKNQNIRLKSSDKVVSVGEIVGSKVHKHSSVANQLSKANHRFKALERTRIHEMDKSLEYGYDLDKQKDYDFELDE